MSVVAPVLRTADEGPGPRGPGAGAHVAGRGVDPAPRAPWWLAVVPWLLLVAAGAVVLLDPDLPGPDVLRPVAGLVLLVLPVWTLARRLPWDLDTEAHAWLLGLGLVVLGVISGGLLLNTVLPLLVDVLPAVGTDRPLAEGPVSVAVLVADAALLLWRPRVPLLRTSPLPRLRALVDLRFRLVPTLAALAVVLAVVGAVRLNNGAGGEVALLGRLVVAGLLGAVLLARTDDLRRDVLAVYAAGVGLLLATSLRSWYVSGHDVQREFISFQLTHESGRWSMADYQSAYHACLSVNILPTVVADLTGLSGVVVFKVLLQLVAAALPLVVLLLARSILDRRLAIAAAAVFLAFPTFSSDMAFLVRQEIAFLFFGLALLVAAQQRVGVTTRRALVVAFGIGVVLSHYSTTYLTIITLVIALVFLHGLAWLGRRWARSQESAAPARPSEPAVLLWPGVLLALVAATWLWVSPITQSGGHLLDTARESITNLVDGGGGPASADVSFSILPGQAEATPEERIRLFAKDAIERRESDEAATGNRYVLPVNDAMRNPAVIEPEPDPVTPIGSLLSRVVPVDTANAVLRAGSALVLQLLVLVGLAAIVLRRARGVHRLGEHTRALMVGSVGAIGMVAVVPGLSAEYGVLRAFQQGLVLLAPVVVVGAVTLLGLVGLVGRRAVVAVGVAVVAMMLVLTGAVSTLTGGYTGILATSNTGPYLQLHYLSDAEVAGYRWLGQNAGGRIVQAEVISDKLAANRLQYYPEGGVLVASDMFPATLLDGAVVFLGRDTVRDQVAAEFYTGTIVNYRFPTKRVERKLDVVFSSPDARIYW